MLIVLLVVAVALGFGLSIISQSVTDVEIAGQSEESARVFNAAEAGIEDALKNISGVPLGVPQNILVGDDNIPVNYLVAGENFLEGIYQENDIATVVLGGVADTLIIEWVDEDNLIENPGTCNGVSEGAPASLLVTVIDSVNNITRYGLNACALNGDNGMTDISASGTDGYLRTYSLDVGIDALVRIRPVYNKASIRVTGTGNLPVQAYAIDSRAQSPTLEAKAIQVSRTVPAAPAIFDYVLFSGTNIVK